MSSGFLPRSFIHSFIQQLLPERPHLWVNSDKRLLPGRRLGARELGGHLLILRSPPRLLGPMADNILTALSPGALPAPLPGPSLGTLRLGLQEPVGRPCTVACRPKARVLLIVPGAGRTPVDASPTTQGRGEPMEAPDGPGRDCERGLLPGASVCGPGAQSHRPGRKHQKPFSLWAAGWRPEMPLSWGWCLLGPLSLACSRVSPRGCPLCVFICSSSIC